MIILAFIELIIAVVCSVCFFLGVWTPSTFFMGAMFIAWVISGIVSLARYAKK